MAEGNTFEQVIKERDRAQRESKRWSGTLLEYLEQIKSDPLMTKLAHARIYDLITATGARSIHDTDDPRKAVVQRRSQSRFTISLLTSSSGSSGRLRISCGISIRLR